MSEGPCGTPLPGERMTAPSDFRVGQFVRLAIERLVFQGDGLGRLPDGRVIFVPYGAPGDEVEVEITEARHDFLRGELRRVLAPSRLRAAPPCPYFGTCGGCQWQHLAPAPQLHWKAEVLKELLLRVGKLPDSPVATPLAPVGPWEYRARAQFKVMVREKPRIGFHQRATNRVVDIERCPLLDPRLNGVLRCLRAMRHPTLTQLFPGLREVWVACGSGTGEVVVSLFAHTRDRATLRLLYHRLRAEVPGLQGVLLLAGDSRQQPRLVDRHGHGAIMEQVGPHRFRIDATAFFQVSGLAAEALTALVLELAALTGSERILDLYCGVGTFAVPLASKAGQVVGIEANPSAASDAVFNLQGNGCLHGRAVHAQVEQALPALLQEAPWDLVVLDPPRQGCSRRSLEALAGARVPRLIYVSCDPSTLARDLGILAQAGYRCLAVRPVDLFPQTFHLETVALLTWDGPHPARASGGVGSGGRGSGSYSSPSRSSCYSGGDDGQGAEGQQPLNQAE
jgi:23S rRNA (uracil1939-C5)-methyltransferase